MDCVVDPDDVIVESDESNNSCTPVDFTTLAAPVPSANRWLTLSMRNDLATVYDIEQRKVVDAYHVKKVDGTAIQSLNEVVRHPDGQLYVLYRDYLSTNHRLGLFDPVAGITDIGDAGDSFHDAAMDGDGILYARKRSGNVDQSTLYTIDLETGLATARCKTGIRDHTALAWEPADETLYVVSEFGFSPIDTANFPVDPEADCTVGAPAATPLPPRNYWAGAASGDQRFVADDSGDFRLAADDPYLLQIGDFVRDVHGLVPDPGVSPTTPFDCDTAMYAATLSGAIFGVNREGELNHLATPQILVDDIDYDRANDRLLVFGNLIDGPTNAVLALDPCTGELQETFDLDTFTNFEQIPLRNVDSTTDGRLYGLVSNRSGRSLMQFDLDAEIVTNLGLFPSIGDLGSIALVAREDRVFVDNTSRDDAFIDDTVALRGSPIDDLAQELDSVTLDWGDVVGGPDRRIASIDALPGQQRFVAVVFRSPDDENTNLDDVRSNLLVLIGPDGKVDKIADLPIQLEFITWASRNDILIDGFEESP